MRRAIPVVVILATSAAVACAGSDRIESTPATSATTEPSADASTTVPSSPVTTSPPTTEPPVTTTTQAVGTTAASSTTTGPTTTDAAAPSTAAPTTAAPATAPPPVPTDGVAVVHIGSSSDFPWAPIGWWDGTGWVTGDLLAVPPSTFASVSVSSVDLPAGPLTGLAYSTETDFVCVDDRVGPFIALGTALPPSPLGFGYSAVAVAGDWNPQPRPVAAVGLDADVYQAVGESLVSSAPSVVPSAGDVVQVLRVDLDGDGAEEVLFAFEHISDDTGIGAAGDYSLVIARYPGRAGAVVDQVLFEHVVPETFDFPQPGRASVAAVADLNGDGVMEVAIRSIGWEFSGIEVFEFEDGRLSPVLAGGCGV